MNWIACTTKKPSYARRSTKGSRAMSQRPHRLLLRMLLAMSTMHSAERRMVRRVHVKTSPTPKEFKCVDLLKKKCRFRDPGPAGTCGFYNGLP